MFGEKNSCLQHHQRAFRSPSPAGCATFYQTARPGSRDGGAVPFEEYVDTDNDLITYEAPNEQEIIEGLAEGDQVVFF